MFKAKQIVSPLMGKFWLVWFRITATRLTVSYFILALLHCIIQIILQVVALNINSNAAQIIGDVMELGNIPDTDFAYFEEEAPELRICTDGEIRGSTDMSDCEVVWPVSVPTPEEQVIAPTSSATGIATPTTTARITPSPSSTTALRPTSTSPAPVAPPTSSATSTTTRVAPQPTGIAGPDNDDDDVDSVDSVDSIDDEVPPARPGRRDVHEARSEIVNSYIRSLHSRTVDYYPDRQHTFEAVWDGNRFLGVNFLDMATNSNGAANGTEAPIFASATCVRSFAWPAQILKRTKREDITFVLFQVWVLGMSLVAILNESIPHITAAFFTHVLATAWSGFQIWHTEHFRADFLMLTRDGACNGINVLPQFWKHRAMAEYAVVALNVVALLISAFLSWKMTKLYGWQTFKRLGASRIVHRIYTLVLVLSILIQLSLFFILASMALWLDELFNGVIGQYARRGTLYKVMYIVFFVLLIPWLSVGWTAVRKESKILMAIFLGLSAAFIAGWGAMFHSNTYRLTFREWPFFSLFTVAAASLTCLTAVLAIVCYFNFGKGLLEHLNAQRPLEEEYDPYTYGQTDVEKVNFPTHPSAYPSFAVAFGTERSSTETMSEMQFARAPSPTNTSISRPPDALTRSDSGSSRLSYSKTISSFGNKHAGDLERIPSDGSQRKKRWEID